jgi:hydroxylamine dehydrogenase
MSRSLPLALACILATLLDTPRAAAESDALISEETEECLSCHEDETPGIVADWYASRHAHVAPGEILEKPSVDRRMSSTDIPESLRTVAVGCYECHGLRTESHKDSFDHNDFEINVIVSPDDCRVCHAKESDEYAGTKKAHAVGNLEKNPVYHTLVETVTGLKAAEDGALLVLESSPTTRAETCFACHGTEIVVKGMKTVDTGEEEVEVPDLEGWPNHGVGRINPDGSMGACTSCHPRHAFSVEVARKPHTCSQCHLNPDVPGWEVWRESKHGNITLSDGAEWDWDAKPWVPGRDFRAPSCAVCHNALLANPDGEVIAEGTHDFGARLWVRLFGLVYSHPQPKSGDTSLIRNADGLPLPLTFAGEPAAAYLIDAAEQGRRQLAMRSVCQACHATDYANEHFERLQATIEETDRMTLAATELLQKAWALGIADAQNPFDEPFEIKWCEQWLFWSNSIRYGSAMAGPDYTTFKNGWWKLTSGLRELEKMTTKKKRRSWLPW